MKHCTTCLDNGSLVPAWLAHPVLCQTHASEEMDRILSEATPEEWAEAYKRVA